MTIDPALLTPYVLILIIKMLQDLVTRNTTFVFFKFNVFISLFLTRCECPKGYHGMSCNEKIDFCKNNPCFNKGVCKNLNDDFFCECPKTFYGTRCEQKKNGDFMLNFPRSGTTDFVKLDGFDGALSEVSSLWLWRRHCL